MIGGLSAVKETLRQCITYPLKYPRLYQEGIAAEAVKGVLLFGPPGEFFFRAFLFRYNCTFYNAMNLKERGKQCSRKLLPQR